MVWTTSTSSRGQGSLRSAKPFSLPLFSQARLLHFEQLVPPLLEGVSADPVHLPHEAEVMHLPANPFQSGTGDQSSFHRGRVSSSSRPQRFLP
jgi:hypothetical protein